MKQATMSRVLTPRGLIVFAALALVAILGFAIGADEAAAKKKKKKDAQVTVMTRNVFLGADLGPAIGAATLPDAIDGAGEIYNELVSTNFPARARLLTREINKAKPDLVGLQEVAHWRVQDPSDGGWRDAGGLGDPATETKYDFLADLMKGLKRYKVVGVQEEFDSELPVDEDGDDATGSGPLGNPPELPNGDPNPLAFGADLDARLTMRDVILVRKGSKVKTKKKSLKMDHYENAFVANVGGVEITADRGWLSVEAKVKGTKKRKGARFRFVNTHLEAFGDPEIREAQAKELFAKGGPLRTKRRLILVGDINSGLPKPHNIGPGGGGSADPDDPLAFRALKKFGMKDRGAQQSCCWPTVFADELPGLGYLKFTHTVDHVLVNKGSIKSRRAYVTGDDRKVTTKSGLLASDHGGVVSKLKLKKPGKGKKGKGKGKGKKKK